MGRALVLVLLAAGLVGAQAALADGTLAQLVKFLTQTGKAPTRVVALLCEPSRGRALGRALSAQGLQAQVVHRGDAWAGTLPAATESATVVLDTACPGAAQLLATADGADLFRSRLHWVLADANAEDAANQTALAVRAGDAKEQLRLEAAVPRSAALDACYARLDGLLDGLCVQLDSDVAAVCVDAEVVAAVYAYRAAPGLGLRLQLVARWPVPSRTPFLSSARMEADRRTRPGRRLDLEQTVVNTGFVVERPDKFLRLVAEGGISRDLLAAFNYLMTQYIISMTNATNNETWTPTYGQHADVKAGVPAEGLLPMVFRKEVELSGSPIVMLDPVRLKHFEYTNSFVPVSGVMVFRAPPLSYEYNVFTLPFPPSVWGLGVVMVGLCTAMLSLVLFSESKQGGDVDEDDQHDLHTSGDAFLMAVAAVCQQGYTKDLRSIPGRIVVLVMLMLLLLLYTCYSASIVVLMQSTSSKITHYRDLLHSDMKFGIINIPYVLYFASTETEAVRHKVWTDKVLEKGKRKHHYSVADGVRKVQKEYFAFYGIRNHIYATIQRTFTEEEKCGLVHLYHDFVRAKDPMVAIRKDSHNVKAFKIMIRKMSERGVWHRFYTRYTYATPACTNKAAAFNSVSLTDVRGAFFMLMSLASFSIVALLGELLWHRRTESRMRARARRERGGRAQAFVQEKPKRRMY